MYGDPFSNWLSFWVNSKKGGWVQEAEIDSLELMNGKLAHNFAGLGHQVAFKSNDRAKGHVTTWMNEYNAQATDCDRGSQSCAKTGDVATQTWSSGSAEAIKNGSLKHHLDIDIWMTKNNAQLTVSNIKILANDGFLSGCPGATPL